MEHNIYRVQCKDGLWYKVENGICRGCGKKLSVVEVENG